MAATPTGGRAPIGVYDEPPAEEDAPQVTAVLLPEEFGPFRLKEYGKGFRFLTRARDYFMDIV